jgi:hypothetical protein
MALSPLDPKIYHPLCAKGYAYFFAGNYEEASKAAHRALLGRQKPEMAYRILIASLVKEGNVALAKAVTKEFLGVFPHFRISEWRARSKFTSDERFDTMESMLRSVGIAE